MNTKIYIKLMVLMLLSTASLAQTVSTIAHVRASGDIAVADNGDVYIADFGNPSLSNGSTVVKITPAGVDSLFATGLSRAPSGIVLGKNGDVLVATYVGGDIYSITSAGVKTVIARANGPVGLAFDDQDNLYVAECNANRISRINNGQLFPIANGGGMACPNGLVWGHDGALYTVNHGNSGMYRVGLDGVVTLFASVPGGGNGHVEYDGQDYYVTGRKAHQIFKVSNTGVVSLLAGSGVDGNADGDAAVASFSRPNGLGISTDGSELFVIGNSDFSSPTLAIRKVQLLAETVDDNIPINPGLSGAWYNPATDGQGFFFDINDDINFFFGGWFTYIQSDAANFDVSMTTKSIGATEHNWLTLNGQYSGDSADLQIGLSSNGLFDNGVETGISEVGTVNVTFSDCTSGRIIYDLALPDVAPVTGEIPITRLTPDAFCQSFVDALTKVTVTYLGNDGVLVSDGEESVILDGIGDFGNNPWINVPIATQNQILSSSPPFDHIVAVTISHGHSDHFNIAPVTGFINQNDGVVLFVPQDTRNFFPGLASRIDQTILPRFGSSSRQVGDVNIITVETRHFNQFDFDFSADENHAYVVEMSGKRIIHMGDIDYASDNFQAIRDSFEGDVDAVILPMFNTMLSQANANLVQQYFPEATVIAAHVRSGNQNDLNNIQQFYPEAVVFTQPLTEIQL